MTLTNKVLVDLENAQIGNIYTISLIPDVRLECHLRWKESRDYNTKKLH